MSYAAVAEKLKTLPETDLQEISDFVDFMIFKNQEKELKNGPDEAIDEVERGEVDVYKSFDDFKAAMS